jgi:hypothetical protein
VLAVLIVLLICRIHKNSGLLMATMMNVFRPDRGKKVPTLPFMELQGCGKNLAQRDEDRVIRSRNKTGLQYNHVLIIHVVVRFRNDK